MFSNIRQKPTQILPWKLLKEATIHFYCLFDKSRFSDICTIMELKQLNWFCKHMKNVRSSQPFISMNIFSKAPISSMRVSLTGFCIRFWHFFSWQIVFLHNLQGLQPVVAGWKIIPTGATNFESNFLELFMLISVEER